MEEVGEHSLILARRYIRENRISRSYAHYLVYARSRPERVSSIRVEFLSAFFRLCDHFRRRNNVRDLIEIIRQTADVFPENVSVLNNYGDVLFLQDSFEDAENCYRKSLRLDPDNLETKERLYGLCNSVVERWHFRMLNDSSRNEAYRKAIHYYVHVKQCNTVLDIGTGTGLLSIYASEAGADRIYACEASDVMVRIATQVFRSNKISERIKLIPKLSTSISKTDLPEIPKLMVTETFDAGLFGEHILDILDDAWKRLIREKETQIIPSNAILFIRLVDSTYIKCRHEFDSTLGYLNSPRVRLQKNESYDSEDIEGMINTGHCSLLSDTVELVSLSFRDPELIRSLRIGDGLTCRRELFVIKSGTLHCVGFGFELLLSPGNRISTLRSSSCWESAVFPVIPGIPVRVGEIIRVEFTIYRGILEMTKCHLQARRQHREVDIRTVSIPDDGILRECNDSLLSSSKQWLSYRIASHYADRPIKILDASRSGLLSLQILKLIGDERCEISILMTSDVKSKIDFMIEIAQFNDLPLQNVHCVSHDDRDDAEKEEEYDVIVTDPVSLHGKLDRDLFTRFPEFKSKLNRRNGIFCPWKLTIFIQLIESAELIRLSRVTETPKLAEFINVYSVNHFQDVNLRSLTYRRLSDPFRTGAIVDFNRLSNTEVEVIQDEIKTIENGTVHGILYWFVQDYGWDIQISTTTRDNFERIDCAYSQAIIIEVMEVQKDEILSVTTRRIGGILDIALAKNKKKGSEET